MRLRLVLTESAFVRLVVYHSENDHGRSTDERATHARQMYQQVMALRRRLDRNRVQTNEDGDEEIIFFMNI